MKKLNESDFANLAPRSQPYEIRAEVDLALRIFPNGTKTWVYIFFDQAVVQRETLGTYPEMSAEQAYTALEEARLAAFKASELVVQKNRAAKIKPPAKSYTGRISAVAASMFTAALMAAYLPMGNNIVDATDTASPKTVNTTVPPTVKHTEQETPATLVAAIPTQTPVVETEVATTSPQIEVIAITKPAAEVVAPVIAAADLESDVSLQSNGLVKRAQFTSGIEQREPIDQIYNLPANEEEDGNAQQLYFFTEVAKLEGHTIYHRWQLNGEVMAEIPFEVKSNWRWRVFSSKKIMPSMQGDWQVTVVDDNGNELHSEHLSSQPVDDAVDTNEEKSGASAIALLQQ
jgi:hypothetical protein